MSFSSMRNIMAQKIQGSSHLSSEFRIARVMTAWNNILCKMWGEEKGGLVRVISFQEGILKLATSVPAAKQQLHIESTRLLNEVNRQLHAQVVKKIIVMSDGF